MGETAAVDNRCQYCGRVHLTFGVCPMVKAMEFYENGTLKRVEFHTPAPIPLEAIKWPQAIAVSFQ